MIKTRILTKVNDTLVDQSRRLSDYFSQDVIIAGTPATSAIYIGSYFPFNSLYFKPTTVNTLSADQTISYWQGADWQEVDNFIDETWTTTDNLFGQSGHISFVPSDNFSWVRQDTNDSNGNSIIPDIGSITIKDMFWLKIEYANSLTTNTSLRWIGHIFCSDNDLFSVYRDLSKSAVLTAYQALKTNWEEQRMVASDMVASMINRRRLIDHPNQLLIRDELKWSTVYKTAALIFANFGEDFKDQKEDAEKKFYEYASKDIFSIDKNQNAEVSVREVRINTGAWTR